MQDIKEIKIEEAEKLLDINAKDLSKNNVDNVQVNGNTVVKIESSNNHVNSKSKHKRKNKKNKAFNVINQEENKNYDSLNNIENKSKNENDTEKLVNQNTVYYNSNTNKKENSEISKNSENLKVANLQILTICKQNGNIFSARIWLC